LDTDFNHIHKVQKHFIISLGGFNIINKPLGLLLLRQPPANSFISVYSKKIFLRISHPASASLKLYARNTKWWPVISGRVSGTIKKATDYFFFSSNS